MHQYDRDVLLHIRDTMRECDMQPNYRFNDIVLPGQNWVTDQPANARGQGVRKRNKTGEFLCNLQTQRDYKDCCIVCFT